MNSREKSKNTTNLRSTKTIKKTKRHIKWKNIFLLLFFSGIVSIIVYFCCQIKITNIYIKGNNLLADQEIIEIAQLQDYPSIIDVLLNVEDRLKEEPLINKVDVILNFRKLTIVIDENYPLFYNTNLNQSVLLDGKQYEEVYEAPLLINYVPDVIYDSFVEAMQKVDYEIINRISEIKYDPDDVDDQRFLLAMRDGNYVYLTITKWDNINSYVSIIKEFPDQKGILYLNVGNSFEVFE